MQKYPDHSRWRQARTCTRKKQYATKGEALERMKRSGLKSIYRCEFCNLWHLSSLIPKGNHKGEA